MADGTYVIADEPVETDLRHYIVDPNAPLLAAMLCGAWLALPWFVWNAVAMGSPTRRKELALCVATLAGTALAGFVVLELWDREVIASRTTLQLALLGIVAGKLAMAYAISIVQARTFEVYEAHGGAVRPATYVLGAGYWLSGIVVGLSDSPLWKIIVSGGL
ncbi:MAG: hypothetical protein WKG01_24305 [Kofleriaceae bacterium]